MLTLDDINLCTTFSLAAREALEKLRLTFPGYKFGYAIDKHPDGHGYSGRLNCSFRGLLWHVALYFTVLDFPKDVEAKVDVLMSSLVHHLQTSELSC